MAYNDHPELQNPPPQFSDARGEFSPEELSRQFIRYAPHARHNFLNEMAKAVSADDGVTLRQKSQLLNMHRQLSDLDRALKWAKR